MRRLPGLMLALWVGALASCGGGSEAPAGAAGATPQAAAAEPQAADLTATAMLDWAERDYAVYFPGRQPNLTQAPFTYRFYPATGNYVGVAGDDLYILGPVAGSSAPLRVGSTFWFTCRALPQNCASAGSVVSGTAIGKGAAMSAAAVSLRDMAGALRTTTTSASGTYALDVSGMAPPFVVTVSGLDSRGVANTLVSIGRAQSGTLQTQRINLTPWTTALAAMLSPTGKAAELDASRDRGRISGTLTVVITYSRTLIAPSLVDAGVSSDYDPITAALVANGSGMAALYNNLTVGTTPSNAVFMADATKSPCSPNQLGGCVRYSSPGTQSTTNPNVCGSSIATGAPIPCDSSLPATSVPPAITINANQAYQFGCLGCVFWGPADNYAAAPMQTPIRVSAVVTVVQPVTPAPGASTWYAHFSATACAAGFCASGGSTTGSTSYTAQADCQAAAAIVNSTLQSSAVPGLTWSYSCNQTP